MRRLSRWMLVAALVAGGGLFQAASAAPVPVPPLPLPPVNLPVPSQLKPVTSILGPVANYDCIVFGSVSDFTGLGFPIIASQIPEVSFQYIPTYVDALALLCRTADTRALFTCSGDKPVQAALGVLDQEFASATKLPVGLDLLPVPTTPIATLVETIDAAAAAAGQASVVDAQLAKLGCTIGVGSSAAPSSSPPSASTPPVTPPAATPVGPTGGGGAAEPSALPSSPPPIPAAAPAQPPTPPSAGAATAAPPNAGGVPIASEPLAATHDDGGTQPIVILLLVGALLAVGALWRFGTGGGSAEP